ncbi:hypothetical protein DUI87_18094 [Hirundo rustica rustica]|uniref:Uncharacterized protein n=1 Tax=Hirundo rustica rustica TaxID=333673 RepID=A0A3M0JVQ7_HIRRU|nr:hypothetical protein DUI87_18094 [Hirundo rustica rustica]
MEDMEDPIMDKLDATRRLFLHGELMPEQAPGRTCGLVERGVRVGEVDQNNKSPSLSYAVFFLLSSPAFVWKLMSLHDCAN